MNARELLKAGKLDEAIKAVSAELRESPADTQRRTFLFELLCFAGEFDRAEKHLSLLADSSEDAHQGAALYTGALHAERTRLERFNKGDLPIVRAAESQAGFVNGQAFGSIADADERVGPRLELFAAGACVWMSFEHIVSIETGAPSTLRNLLWLPALVRTGSEFQEEESEALIPVLYPRSFADTNENVRLGRETYWNDEGIPFGQRMFVIDGEAFPLLEIRKLEFYTAGHRHHVATMANPGGVNL